MAGGPQSPRSAEWKILYRVAIYQTNNDDTPERISDAEEAIVERVGELFRANGADVEVEREALEDALYALRAWKAALENRTRAA